MGLSPFSDYDAKASSQVWSNKRNVNHKRQGSTITRIGCSSDAAQVELKPVALRDDSEPQEVCRSGA
jgi:hypothetical protein